MPHTMSWRALTAVTITAITVSAYPSQTFDHTARSNNNVYCPVSELCILGSCTNTTIGLDPKNCGTYGNSCDPGEICVVGECRPLDIGTKKCDTACKPGQWCNDGLCVAIEIAANSRICGIDQKDCGAGAICINGQCQTLDIDPESTSCGPNDLTCDAGTWCLDAACIPFILGTYPQACDDKTRCPLGSSCHNGQCQQVFISTDVYNCGDSSESCTAGQLCVSGSCESLSITEEKYQTDACGSSKRACDPGFFCWEDECLPISISADFSQCGKSSKACGSDELCISGICIKSLFREAEPSITTCSSGSSGINDRLQSPSEPSRSGSSSNEKASKGKGSSSGKASSDTQGSSDGSDNNDVPFGRPGGKPSGNGSSGGSSIEDGYPGYSSGKPQYGNGSGDDSPDYYPDSGSRPGSGSGDGVNNGGTSNFGPGRPGPDDDGKGSPAPACSPDCSSNEICVCGECLTVSDPLSCGPSSSLSRQQTQECPAGFACVEDRCVPVESPINCGGSDCPINYACVDDACVGLGDPADCAGEACADDEICLGETCTSNPDLASCFGVVCPSGQRCLAGDCVAAGPTTGNPQGNGGRPGDEDTGDDADPDDQPSLTITVSGSITVIPNPAATTGLEGVPEGIGGSTLSDGSFSTDSNGNPITTPVVVDGSTIFNPVPAMTGSATTNLAGRPEGNGGTSTFGVIVDGSTTITFGIDPTETGIVCTIDEDCTLDIELCVVNGLNVCICRAAVCIIDPELTPDGPTTTGTGGPTITDDFPPPPTGTTACSIDEDCLTDSNACLFNSLNICSCVDGICVQQPITGGPQGSGSAGVTDGPELTTLDGPDGEPTATITLTGTDDNTDVPELTTLDGSDVQPTATETLTAPGETDGPEVTTLDGTDGEPTATVTLTAENPEATETETPCTTDDDCLAQIGLCVDGLVNLCSCVDAVCVLPDLNDATTTATDGAPTPTGVTACSTEDECITNADLCVIGGLNICVCLNAVCIPLPNPDATTSGVAPTETADTSCSTAGDCAANASLCLNGLVNLCLCVDSVCVPSGGGTGDACSVNSDCTTAGDECDNNVCAPAGAGTDACVDANDCLLSVKPLCVRGLCVCTNNVCTTSPDVQECTGDGDCSTGASCQNGVCVDEIQCNSVSDCLANLDLCVLPDVCACVGGICGLVGNGPEPECTVISDCSDLTQCSLGLCLCEAGQCVPG
ncbi:hypothetical protein ACLX1H_000139 [Fusarium chlamydosporum]